VRLEANRQKLEEGTIVWTQVPSIHGWRTSEGDRLNHHDGDEMKDNLNIDDGTRKTTLRQQSKPSPYFAVLIDNERVEHSTTKYPAASSLDLLARLQTTLLLPTVVPPLAVMAKPRRKKRTHMPATDGTPTSRSGTKRPKSMVIRMGASDIGSSISQLTKDFRAMMEPDTASRLKERKANRLKDYTAMAGPLGVTHLFLFSRSKTGNVHLRVALTPRGPTLTFRVEGYALCKDIARAQRQPRGGGKEYLHAPLLVMNNFTTPASAATADGAEGKQQDPIKKQLESLTTTIFQSMFPPISPTTTPLSSIRRILLLNREPQSPGSDTYIVSLRHYAITTRRTGIPKRIRRFNPSEQRAREKKTGAALPNLGKLEDMSEYLLDPSAAGYTSASETELDTDNEVEVLETTTQRVLNKKEQQRQSQQSQSASTSAKPTTHDYPSTSNVEKRAIKLHELGPRMRLHLVKIEEGICEGRVMWNEFVTKSSAEEKALDEKWAVRRREKEERRKVQRENVERKREAKANARRNSGKGDEGGEGDEGDEWDSEDLEDYDPDDDDDDVEMEGEVEVDGEMEIE
jgi:ribosome biogenesis protein SSF1/2